MSTAPLASPTLERRLPRVLLILTLTHGLVDAYAAFIQPLWPDLQHGLALSDIAMQAMYVLWSLTTSVSQLAFSAFGARVHGGWWLWAGTGAGVVSMSALGLVHGWPPLIVLLVVGGLGIAAFHPEAAVIAGSCAPERRSQALSLFAVGGYIGQAIGPIISGVITTRLSPSALFWTAPFGLMLVAVLGFTAGPVSAPLPSVATPPVSFRRLLHGRHFGVGLLLSIGILRVLPATGISMAIAYLLKLRGETNAQIGVIQSVFLGGIGAGSLGCALFVRRASERQVLWVLPALGVPFVLACPMLGNLSLGVAVAIVGITLGAVMPILIGYGQHLMPEAQRVASSLTMGVTWGVGGMILAALMATLNHLHRPDLAFPIFAVSLVVSCLLCRWLPKLHATP